MEGMCHTQTDQDCPGLSVLRGEIRESLTEEVTFEQRPEGGEGTMWTLERAF